MTEVKSEPTKKTHRVLEWENLGRSEVLKEIL
jgi:hypothetical protein